MFDLRFHHVGIACTDIERVAHFVGLVFDIASDTGTVYDANQGSNVRLLRDTSGMQLELISGKPVEKIVKKGGTYYHICFETPDMESAIAHFKKQGSLLVSPPTKAVLFDHRRVSFLYTVLGLVELLEAK